MAWKMRKAPEIFILMARLHGKVVAPGWLAHPTEIGLAAEPSRKKGARSGVFATVADRARWAISDRVARRGDLTTVT
jgi:hypothetical protein